LLLFLVYADYGIIAFQLNDKSSPYMKDFGKELSDIFDKPKEDWKRFFDYIQQKVRLGLEAIVINSCSFSVVELRVSRITPGSGKELISSLAARIKSLNVRCRRTRGGASNPLETT
jgi:hypothetical protein